MAVVVIAEVHFLMMTESATSLFGILLQMKHPMVALGLGVRTHMEPVVSGSNSPVGEFGWSGWAGAFTLVDPQNRLSLFYASHVTDNIDGYSCL